MNQYSRLYHAESAPPAPEDMKIKSATDRVMMQLMRVTIIAMLAMMGFLLNSYLYSINKAIDNLAASLGRISQTQEQLSIMAARIDISVHHIEQRLGQTEQRLDSFPTNQTQEK